MVKILIRLYQKTLSPDHSWLSRYFPGGYCPFRPSCSEYAYLAFDKYGFWKGLWKSFLRVLSCHPWARGGLDLP